MRWGGHVGVVGSEIRDATAELAHRGHAVGGSSRSMTRRLSHTVSPPAALQATVVEATDRGPYTLVFAPSRPVEIEVGALGAHRFPAGADAYTGSAMGRGGFARVDRHRRVAAADHDVRHWHVDHLAGHPATDLVTHVETRGVDVECAVAGRLPGGPVAGFGASDCACRSHLAAGESTSALVDAVEAAHGP